MAEHLSWVDVDGVEHDLTGDGVTLQPGPQGRVMPPVEFSEDIAPTQAGTRLRKIRFGAREVSLPLFVRGRTAAERRERLREWATRFSPVRGDGKLRAQVDGFEPRDLPCRYVGGLEGDEGDGWPAGQRFVAVFRAFDPFWEDVNPNVSVAQVDAIVFLSPDASTPWFPWETVEVDVQGGFNVTNDGDDAAFPVWTVQGPGGPVTLANITTGETLEVDTVLSAGQQLHIDTRPDVKTVVGPAGVNLWPQVTDPSTLWPLPRGSQTVQVQIVDSVPGETQVRLEWRRRWLSA